jgi:hypothetical protein
MKTIILTNSEANQAAIPYFIQVDIQMVQLTRVKIPIWAQAAYHRKALYSMEICGFHFEGNSAEELAMLAERTLATLVYRARLPTYTFMARHSHHAFPVYTIQDEVMAITPGGPTFRHVELAKVRDYLTNYLETTGDLWLPGHQDKLHVRGIQAESLALVRPWFYLKKRPMLNNEHEFWAPAFPADDGQHIYTFAASGRREVEIAGGHEVLQLKSQVAQALIADKRLHHNHDLRIDRLLPEVWAKVESVLIKTADCLYCPNLALPIYQYSELLIALEYRATEKRYSLYIGQNRIDLRESAATDLVRRGLIKANYDVKWGQA